MNSFLEAAFPQFAVSPATVYILAAAIIGFILMAVLILYRRKPSDSETAMLHLQQQIESIREQMDKSIDRTTNQINIQLEGMSKRVDEAMKANLKALTDSSRTFSDKLQDTTKAVESVKGTIGKLEESVKGSIGKLEESSKRIYEVGKDISGLQDLLKPPKLRGGLGELFLEHLLAQILPKKNYDLQYGFRGGERVDAVIHLGDKMVCIDSKFPLEDFQRITAVQDERERKSCRRRFNSAVKKHIDDISSKYIRADEGTYDFAFMYIPAENVYYETIAKDEELGEEKGLQSYAMEKHVIPVSPNSFFAYLFTVVLGLKGLEIEKNAEEVMARLRTISKELEKFRDDFNTLGTHIKNASGKYDSADKQLSVLDGKLDQISQIEQSGQPTEITD